MIPPRYYESLRAPPTCELTALVKVKGRLKIKASKTFGCVHFQKVWGYCKGIVLVLSGALKKLRKFDSDQNLV